MTNFLHRILVPAAAAAVALLASAASAQTYSNPANISIPTFGVANPYPSPIAVSGGPTSVGLMTVTLTNFSHTFPRDVSVMLLGPTGASTILYGRAGSGFNPAGNPTLVFRDGAPALPSSGAIVSGEFAPTILINSTFSPPAPATPTTASLGTFTGSDANGQWRLYVQDFESGDFGFIGGGWSITFAPPVAAQDASFTYQGKLDSGSAAITGAADFRFSLWSSAANTIPAGQVGATITRSAVLVTDGLFTASLDFGFGVVDNKSLFLQTEVRSPAGSGSYTTLTPRQPLTAALNAQFARKAALADNSAQLNNQPASAYLPPAASVWSVPTFGAQPFNNACINPTVVPISSASVTTVPGSLVVSWSTTANTNIANTSFRVRARLATGAVGAWSLFYFNQANVHMTISGNAVLPITLPGSDTIQLEVQRATGSGNYLADPNDGVSGTIIQIKQ